MAQTRGTRLGQYEILAAVGDRSADMRRFTSRGLLLLTIMSTPACILRPGMNADCRWPPERTRQLDLSMTADQRHLVVDAELLEELVDRFRFHPADEQRQCEDRLIAIVARAHSVDVSDVVRARHRTAERGLDLLVNVPVAALFLLSVVHVVRRIERRFVEEPLPFTISLVVASVALSALLVWVGELWTSILQMIRVGSQHVGGRVQKLPWLQHEQQILMLALLLFWTVVLLRRTPIGRRSTSEKA